MVAVKEFSWEEISGPDFGNPARQAWPQAVAQVEEQLRVKLHVEVLPERMRKALELVGAHAVTLQADGSASVQSGKQTYTLAPDCPCADAKHRTELCKHTLAVELHRRALALVEGTAPAPAAPPPAALSTAPSAPASQAWDVHEAPASACFKFRVGNMEFLRHRAPRCTSRFYYGASTDAEHARRPGSAGILISPVRCRRQHRYAFPPQRRPPRQRPPLLLPCSIRVQRQDEITPRRVCPQRLGKTVAAAPRTAAARGS